MGIPKYPHVPVWLPGALWDPQSNSGFHLAATFHSLACNDRGHLGQSDWKGPGRITGGVSVHSRDGVRFQSLIRSACSRQGEPEQGAVGNLNASGSAAQ